MVQTKGPAAEVFPGITMDPEVRFGKPCITGTRIDVATVIGAIAAGESIEAVERSYSITKKQVQAALQYAAHLADYAPPAVKDES